MVKIRDICDYVALTLLILAELIMYCRLRLKVDRAGVITLMIFTFIFLLRALDGLISESNTPPFLIMVSVTQSLIWSALYYFTFELRLIYLTITSGSKLEYIQNLTKLANMRIVVLSLLTFFYLPLMAAQTFTQNTWPDFYYEN